MSLTPRPETEFVLSGLDGRLGRLVLNRPRAINACNTAMVAAMAAQMTEWLDAGAVDAISLVGAGEKGLCAGGDVRAVREDVLAGRPADGAEFFSTEYLVNGLIDACPVPYLAYQDGVVMGGGIGVSAHGSHRLVTERSRLAMPETIIGWFPDTAALTLMARMPGEIGTHLALTGATIGPADAIALGFADTLIDGDIDAVLDAVAAGAPVDEAVAPHRRTPGPTTLLDTDWIDECYAGNDAAVIAQRLAASSSPDARAAADLLAQRSPLAVHVTLRALREAARRDDVQSQLAADTELSVRMLAAPHDFVEGVRALLVDRDRAPRWAHASLADVDASEVDALVG